MANKSSIEWTDRTWNPTRGCRRISPGCEGCYAEKVANRFKGAGLPYEGLVTLNGRWNGKARFVVDALDAPLHWKRPQRIFVDSMSDLFYEEFTDEQIAAVFGVMAAAHWHTFQVLTKRPARAAKWFRWLEKEARTCNGGIGMPPAAFCLCWAQRLGRSEGPLARDTETTCAQPWPLRNVHIGVSVEDKPRADERLPWLLHIPAAVRFVSYEPALELVNFRPWMRGFDSEPNCRCLEGRRCYRHDPVRIDWLIIGGESGPSARPFDLAWARSTVRQCKEAGLPVFVKQLGAKVLGRDCEHGRAGQVCHFHDPKGGDMSEWPADLKIREFPKQSDK